MARVVGAKRRILHLESGTLSYRARHIWASQTKIEMVCVDAGVLTVGTIGEILVRLAGQVSQPSAAGRLALDVFDMLVILHLLDTEKVFGVLETYGLRSMETLHRRWPGSRSFGTGLGKC